MCVPREMLIKEHSQVYVSEESAREVPRKLTGKDGGEHKFCPGTRYVPYRYLRYKDQGTLPWSGTESEKLEFRDVHFWTVTIKSSQKTIRMISVCHQLQ